MQRIAKISCFLLALLMLVLSLAACDDKGKGALTTPATTTTTPGDDGGVPYESYDENGYRNDHIDYASIDYGDQTVKVLTWYHNKEMLFPETMQPGESLSNVVYERNHQISEELGIQIVPIFKYSHMSSNMEGDGQELYNAALNAKAGDYDAIVCYSHFPAMMASQGILEDLNTLQFPETDMPWYPEGISSWGFNNRLFFVANNSCVQNILASWCIFANREMIADKNLEDIEEVVLSGNWTLDKLDEYVRNWEVEAESNNPNDKTDPDNVYGFAITHRTVINGFYHAAGFSAYSKDATDSPVAMYNTKTYAEQISGFLDKFFDICDSPAFMMGKYSGDIYYPLENKNTVFFAASLDAYKRLEMEDKTYCVIPMPKLNDQQQEYRTLTRDVTELWCVPKVSEDPEIGGLLIEAISSSDYRLMAPKFFDKDFKYRYSSDENGVKIFDLIRSSFVTEFGSVWSQALSGPYAILQNCVNAGDTETPFNNNYANIVEGTRGSLAKDIQALKAKMAALFPQ